MKKLTERQNRALVALKNRPFLFWKSKRKSVGANRGFPMNVLEALVTKGYASEHVADSQVSSYMLGSQGGTINFDQKVLFKAIPES